uniref:Uncharacterized protein n=1 Tax=Meloidogyne incognita TaxID=6306 RepID=A0A914LS61_MELIC
MGPKDRGRGVKANSTLNSNSGSRRIVVPNIAAAASRILAPKWADTKPNASDAVKSEHINGESSSVKSEKGRGRGRPPGRGKGRGGSTKQFIASEGVFSQGIGEDAFGNQRTRGVRLKNKDEEIIGKLESSLQEDTKDEDKLNEKDKEKKAKKKRIKLELSTSENLYEEFWQSDDELDREELDELCGGSFIADLKKCEQLPFVLPNNEAQQFNRIIKKRRKEDGEECQKDVKDIKLKEILLMEEASKQSKICLREEKFQLAANTIQRLANDNNSNNQLLLFQLPSIPLLRIAETRKQNILEDEQPPKKSSNKSIQEPQLKNKNCLELFPSEGTRIGKLQFLRSGKAVLNIGGHQMDISESINSESFEARIFTLLRVEVTGRQQQQNSKDINLCGLPFNLNNGISTSHHSIPGTAHLLGPLPFHFVCSFDIKRALQTSNDDSAPSTSSIQN